MKLTRPIVFFDLETTGTDVANDRIIEFAAVKYFHNGISRLEHTFRCNPGIPIPAEAAEVHGITSEMVKLFHPFTFFATGVYNIVSGCDLAGFNLLNFDVPMLWEEFNRCGLHWDLTGIHIVDAGNIFKKQEPRTLSAGVKFYCGRDHDGAHEALADVVATAEVLSAQRRRYPELGEMDVAQLAAFSRMDERVDLAGHIGRNKAGEPVYTAKRVRGVRVVDDPGFGSWMLRNDFPKETKTQLRRIFQSQ